MLRLTSDETQQQCQNLLEQTKQYEDKINSQKNLLIKAKQTIDKLRTQLDDQSLQLTQEKEKSIKLEGIVTSFLGSDEQANKESEQMLANVIKQYEERMKRIQDHYEKNEKQLLDIQIKQKNSNEIHEDYRQELVQQLKQLIIASEDIREACFQYLGDFEDETYRVECQNKIKLLLMQMQKIVFEEDYSCFNQLKNHLLVLHQSLFDLNKKLSSVMDELSSQEISFKDQADHLKQDIVKERLEKAHHITNGRQHIRQLEQQMETLNTAHSKKNKEHEQKIESHQKEMLRNVNVQYIKNIMISYFCNNESVQQKTIPVIATVLQFTEPELQQVKQAWEYQQKTSLGKLFSLKTKKQDPLDSPK